MDVKFQLLDLDYVFTDKPILRLFGKTQDNKPITAFYEKFLPYFYILPVVGKEDELKQILKNKYKELVLDIETIEKSLPVGYSKTTIKLFKVTLKNPSKTPLIRDEVRSNRIVKDIFEADILFKYRFMADNDIFGMRWYQASGNVINTNTVKTRIKLVADEIKELSVEKNVDLKYMSIDIEVLTEEGSLPEADKDPIIIISMAFEPPFRGKKSLILVAKKTREFGNDIKTFLNEKEMLKEFLRLIDQYDPDIILGYNINNFDLPYIDTRLKKNNLSRKMGRCNQKQLLLRKFANKTRCFIAGRIIVDVYDLVKEATIKFGLFRGLKRYGLSDVSKLILNEEKLDVLPSEIGTYWKDSDQRFKKLLDYSRKDAELPLKILLKERMLDKFLEISKVSGLILQDSLNGGESTRIENILLRDFNKKNYIMQCKPTSSEISRRNIHRRSRGLKGAFVLDPDIGFHDKCVVYLDFRSMYPSIIMSFNICPTTLVMKKEINEEFLETPNGTKFVKRKVKEGIIPNLLKYLLDTRDQIKREMKRAKSTERKRYLYAKQYAFKTIANAFYGHLGYIRAKLYILDIANSITGAGRYIIKKTKEIVESKTPYKVIYADTDSVMVRLNTKDVKEAFKIGNQLTELINESINHILDMKIESVFKTLLILSKKRYAGWNFEPTDDGWEESIITKGIETVRRDWCDLVSETLQEVLETILKEQDTKKAVKTVRDKIQKIKMGKMEINKLVITKSISKSLKSYKGIQPHIELAKKMRRRDPASAPGVGDRVGFVIVRGLQMISKRTEDPEYVKKHGLLPDSKYYIESQLLPPLERVFDALRVKKSDLMGKGKQMGILDVMKNENKVSFKEHLTDVDGFICNNCNNIFRRVPLSGRCNFCNGEIVFFKGDVKSRVYHPQN